MLRRQGARVDTRAKSSRWGVMTDVAGAVSGPRGHAPQPAHANAQTALILPERARDNNLMRGIVELLICDPERCLCMERPVTGTGMCGVWCGSVCFQPCFLVVLANARGEMVSDFPAWFGVKFTPAS